MSRTNRPSTARVTLVIAAVLAVLSVLFPSSQAAAAETTGPEVMHVASCLAGNGRVDTNIVNSTAGPATYRIEFGALSPRQRAVAALDWWRMPITGRANGVYPVTVTRDGQVISQTTVTVDCEIGSGTITGPEVQIVNACRAGNGYLLFQFLNPTATTRGYVIEFDPDTGNVPNRSTSADPFGQTIRAVTGRPAGSYPWNIRTNGVITHSGVVEVNCNPKEVGPVPLPAQPTGVPFPTISWPIAPLPESADAAAVQSALDAAFATGDAAQFGEIHAALVISGGELVTEEYGNGYSGAVAHPSFSIAKSVTHALLGDLVGDDLLDMAAPAAVPDWAGAADPRGAITPDMLARMSSGLDWEEAPDVVLMTFVAGLGGSAANVQIDRDLVAPVGTTFNYSTGSTAVNGQIMSDIVGRGDTFSAWADATLFDPLGIDSVELEFDGTDTWIAGYGANMTARDFARFGLLYLRDGVWAGNRILPEGWVDYARMPSPANPDYGAGFWVDSHGPDTFAAIGFRGQLIVLVPEQDLIVVVLADGSTAGSSALANELIAAFNPA